MVGGVGEERCFRQRGQNEAGNSECLRNDQSPGVAVYVGVVRIRLER